MAGDDENVLLMEELHGKVLIAFKIKRACLQAREQVKRSPVGNQGHAGDFAQPLHCGLALLIEPPAGKHHSPGAVPVLQGRGNDQLGQSIAAQAHGGQGRHALLHLGKLCLRAGKYHPAAAEAADDMRFGQAVKRHAGKVRCQRRHGIGRRIFKGQPIVNFVRKQQEVVLPGKLGNGQQRLLAVNRAGGVIGVDHQNCLGAAGDLGAHILQVRIPGILRVTAVIDRLAAAEIGIVAPKRIAGRRNKDLVTGAHQGGHQHGDCLADTVANIDILRRDILNAAALVIFQNCLPRCRHAPHIAIGHSLIHIFQQCLPDTLGHLEAEIPRVARVQPQHGGAGSLHPQGFNIQRAPNVRMDMSQSV